MIILMRIDKLLCEMNIGSRSRVKELIKKGMVCIDGVIVKTPDMQVNENNVKIVCQGKEYTYRPYVYYMMNKPSGVITATIDKTNKTVLDLMKEQMQLDGDNGLTGIPIHDIFPVGRLDKETVGLLLLTNDGELAHNLLSPKKHVSKKYFVKTDQPITEAMVRQLEEGVFIGPEEKTRPAFVSWQGGSECEITITEGKYHQIKRMFGAVGVAVIYLKRLSMGKLQLDETLKEGRIRELTQKEVMDLCSRE